MSTSAVKRYTVEEYLALERASETKHEYFDGEIFDMAGASRAHNRIAANLVQQLSNALDDSPCEVYPSDMRVKLPTGLYTYPDVSIVCSEPQFEGDRQDVLLNPMVIVEVLSPSTEAYDRGRKFRNYQTIESLREYVLVSQDRMQVEHFARRPGSDQWLLTTVDDPTGTITLPAIDCALSMAEIYAKVESIEADAGPPRPSSR